MIGVVARPDQRETVEEFFELFKTPWEFCQPGESYDVVLATAEMPARVEARLLVAHGAEPAKIDKAAGLSPSAKQRGLALKCEAETLPLYGEAITFSAGTRPVVCQTAGGDAVGVKIAGPESATIRLGYDLFDEIKCLLTTGQPVENALTPALDLHIELLRRIIIEAAITLVEVAPTPAGYDFSVCLTHDIDFVGIRRHWFDHTMWGFLYRSVFGSLRDFFRGKASAGRLARCWKAAASLPFVFLGWAEDFWLLFDWYLAVEDGLAPTYFFIPFKRRRGEKVAVPHAERRGCAYDIADIPGWVRKLKTAGCEVGVHGIDAWHSAEYGREERNRVLSAGGAAETGIRMHWLLRNEQTSKVLEDAGYAYDSTCGYNETPGYFCGTTQVFRPLGASKLLELPMHIQDGALFYAKRLGLSDTEAWAICSKFVERAQRSGGVLTLLWHDRSPGPERFWGDFYVKLVAKLKSLDVWFANAGTVVSWFRKRRQVRFAQDEMPTQGGAVRLAGLGEKVNPPMRVRIHAAGEAAAGGSEREVVWDGCEDLEIPTAAPTIERDARAMAVAGAGA